MNIQVPKLDITSNYIRIGIGGAVSVGGIGLCYALYKYLRESKPWRRASLGRYDGLEDLKLPLLLEHDYGDFRATCEAADPIASAYLKEIPESFFKFNQELTQYSNDLFKQLRIDTSRKALVIGSEVGRLVFDLARIFKEVKGVDIFFSRTITCYRFQNDSKVGYDFPLEGPYRSVAKNAYAWALDSPSDERTTKKREERRKEAIKFVNEDIGATSEDVNIGQYHVVYVTDEIKDSQDPEVFLKNLHRYVEKNGVLIIYTDYDWVRTSNKVSGFREATVESSFEFLKHTLFGFFNLVSQKYIQDVVGTSLRSCIVRNFHVTVWERNSRPILP